MTTNTYMNITINANGNLISIDNRKEIINNLLDREIGNGEINPTCNVYVQVFRTGSNSVIYTFNHVVSYYTIDNIACAVCKRFARN